MRGATALSALDAERFGFPIAKCTPEDEVQWRDALDYCARNAIRLLVARIDATRVALAQRMERDGALLTDVLLQFRAAVRERQAAPAAAALSIRHCTSDDAQRIAQLARTCFRDYASHYRADPHLDVGACDEIYPDWARRACTDRSVAETVLVAERDGEWLGFAALRMIMPSVADGMLFGVLPAARGQGVLGRLLAEYLAWAAERGASSAVYQTQLHNVAAQRSVVRAGFVPDCAFLTLHLWLRDD